MNLIEERLTGTRPARTACVAWLLPLLLALALPALLRAQDYTYTTNADGLTLTLTGYTGAGGAVTIPTTINGLKVTVIGDWAFEESAMTSVVIPDTITSLGNHAFDYATQLGDITIGNGVTNIGSYAFYFCTSLASVTLPENVVSVGDYAFYLCPTLAGVTIGSGVRSLGNFAFYYCTRLNSVTIPANVTSIGYSAFYQCTGLSALTVAANNPVYSSVDGILFDKHQATLIQCPARRAGGYTIPGSVTNIGSRAFAECTSLTSVTIGNSVISIGTYAFDNCISLTNVMVGTGLASIQDYAFQNCATLAGIYFRGNPPSLGSGVFIGDNATVYYLPGNTNWGGNFGSLATATWPVPDWTYTVNNGTVTLLAYTGSDAAVTIPAILNDLPVSGLGDGVFQFSASLAKVTIGPNITSLGGGVFGFCYSLTTATIGAGVTNLPDYTFASCSSLTALYCQGNAPSVGSSVFDGDSGLTVYYWPGTANWGTDFDGFPTVSWNPHVITRGQNIAVRTNQFSFTVTGTSNLLVVVEACANLANPLWSPVGTNTLINGSFYFSDPKWTNSPAGFYRFSMP